LLVQQVLNLGPLDRRIAFAEQFAHEEIADLILRSLASDGTSYVGNGDFVDAAEIIAGSEVTLA